MSEDSFNETSRVPDLKIYDLGLNENFWPSQPSPDWVGTTLQRGLTANQHPGLMTSSARHSGSLAQSHPHAQPGTSWQVYWHSGTREGFPMHTTPIDFHHSPYPAENASVYPHLTGEPHTILPNPYDIPEPYRSFRRLHVEQNFYQKIPIWQSVSTPPLPMDGYATPNQSNYPVATPPQSSPLHMELPIFFSSLEEVQPPQFVTVPPVPKSSKNVLPAIAPSIHKDLSPKAASFAIDGCPFSECQRKCGRPQELGRHILQHLPHWIYCPQSGCNWTGYRVDVLRAHLEKRHGEAPLPRRKMFIIYNAKGIVKRVLKKEITIVQAEHEALSSFQYKAVQLGVLDVWQQSSSRL